MKIIIAGGTDLPNRITRQEIFATINAILSELTPPGITKLVCGMAPGIDMLARDYAKAKGIPVAEFPAKWREYGKPAGPIRNREMAKYADMLILVWDGESTGSADMLRQARKHNLPIIQAVYKGLEIIREGNEA